MPEDKPELAQAQQPPPALHLKFGSDLQNILPAVALHCVCIPVDKVSDGLPPSDFFLPAVVSFSEEVNLEIDDIENRGNEDQQAKYNEDDQEFSE